MRQIIKSHRRDGPRYTVRYTDVHGRNRYRTFTIRKEAEAFQQEVERGKTLGIDIGQRVRFSAGCDAWEESHLAHGLRPSTVKDYRQSIKRLRGEFGQREIRTIGPVDLERLRNKLIDLIRHERSVAFERVLSRNPALKAREQEIRANIARSGNRAAAKVIGCAATLWKFFVSRGFAARNVAQDVRKPKVETSVESDVIDANILRPAEIAAMTAAAPAEHRIAIRFLFHTGVRFGELLGLMWSDMDWASSRVLVRRQRSGINNELTAPKTRAGTRWIDLDRELLAELKAHRLRTPGEFMFPLDARNWRTRVWHPALRRAGLRAVRIHDARHTHASLLIAAGADIVAVSRRLGHANPAITLGVYSHAHQARKAPPLGEKLAAFMRSEQTGCISVVTDTAPEPSEMEVIEKMVARGGIEPPTRGFSVRCSTN